MAKREEYAMVKGIEIMCSVLAIIVAVLVIALFLPPPQCTLVPYGICYDVAGFK